MAVFAVNQQSHKDYVFQHKEVGQRCADFELARKNTQASADAHEISRNEVGDRARAGLVHEVPSIDAVLEAQITDMFAEVASLGSTDVTKLYTNADAATVRANPEVFGLW